VELVLKYDTMHYGMWVSTIRKNVLTPKCTICLTMGVAFPAEAYKLPRHRLHKTKRYSVRTL
jgi:hypothetical protein